MNNQEFSNHFDIYYNNITSNQAPGLSEHEKSVFITKAEKEVVLNHFSPNSKGNNLGLGFDDSAKRQADFSVLMKTSDCLNVRMGTDVNPVGYIRKYVVSNTTNTQVMNDTHLKFTLNNESYKVPEGTYTVTYGTPTTIPVVSGTDTLTVTVVGYPYTTNGTLVVTEETVTVFGQIDDRSSVWQFPGDVFIPINETIKTTSNKYLQVISLRYDEYTRLMSKPFKRPLKNQAWRLINSGTLNAENNMATKYAEIITNADDTVGTYNIRYVRTPKPVILTDLTADGLTIDGISEETPCELDPILHEEILQRAVELAKIAWTATGNENAQTVVQAGQRSE